MLEGGLHRVTPEPHFCPSIYVDYKHNTLQTGTYVFLLVNLCINCSFALLLSRWKHYVNTNLYIENTHGSGVKCPIGVFKARDIHR